MRGQNAEENYQVGSLGGSTDYRFFELERNYDPGTTLGTADYLSGTPSSDIRNGTKKPVLNLNRFYYFFLGYEKGINEGKARLLQWLVFFLSSTQLSHFFAPLFNFLAKFNPGLLFIYNVFKVRI